MSNFNKDTGAPISKADAEKKSKNWKKNKKEKMKTEAVFIGRDWIEKLLKKDGCTGIWVNLGESDDGKSMEPFFIAGDVNGKYIMSDETTNSVEKTTNDDIINNSTKCPPNCP